MNLLRRTLGLIVCFVMIVAMAQAQTNRSADDSPNPTPSVNGGTGLFTIYDAQTLRSGEFTFGFWGNHFHRDPGDLAIQKYPFSVQVGLGDRFEIFANFVAQEVITTGAPGLLSGFYLPDVVNTAVPGVRVVPVQLPGGAIGIATIPVNRVGPFTALPTNNDTPLYLGLGAPVGGILPAIPPTLLPNYYVNAPFLSRFSDSHASDLWIGGKFRVTGPENPFGFALIPLVKIPIADDLNTGLERGRGTGAFDYGVIAAADVRLKKFVNLSGNIGFIKRGNPAAENMNLGPLCVGCGVPGGFADSDRALDLPNELRIGVGAGFSVKRYLQLIGEINYSDNVGGRTPSLQNNNPVDLVAGIKLFPTRWMSINAAYQRHLNWFDDLDTVHEPNGVLFGFSFGRFKRREPPVPPNRPPTVSLNIGIIQKVSDNLFRESSTTVCAGDRVQLQATAADPDMDTLVYSWNTTGGRVDGSGATAVFDSSNLSPGDYTVTVEVKDGRGGVAQDSKSIRVTNCPPLTACYNPNLEVTADKSRADMGEKVGVRTAGVTGGRNFGNVRYEWKATAGVISGQGLSATLDTTGVLPNQEIEITVVAISDAGNCSASGSTRLSTYAPPPEKPRASELGRCATFKFNNARVDNACKDVLNSQVVRALQADPDAKLLIVGYRTDEKERSADLDLQRAKNTRDRLVDGNLGVAIDANRVSVAPGGLSTDGSQVVIWLVPGGADNPAGVTPVDAGPVTPEQKAPARRNRQ